MPLTKQEQLMLFWLIDEDNPDHIELGSFLEHLEAPGSPVYQDLRRDADRAGVQLPSKREFLELLQGLIERGFALATIGDVDWDEYDEIKDVRKLRKNVDPWDVSLWRTVEGLEEMEAFEQEMENGEKAAESARRHIEEVCGSLPFRAVIPAYFLTDEDILSALEVAANDKTLRLSYEFGMQPFNDVTIDQTIGRLVKLDRAKTVLSRHRAKFASASVTICVHQLAPHIARIVAEWRKNRIATRVMILRQNLFNEERESKGEPVSMDRATRRLMFKIVRSCLSAVPPESRVSTN